MSENYSYAATADWIKGRYGSVGADSAELPIVFSAPPEFHGESGFWTPEHFLVAAVVSCYVLTFVAIAEMAKIALVSLTVSAEGQLEKLDGALQFTRVVLHPVITVGSESDRQPAMLVSKKAERSCLVARSLRGEVTAEPTILVTAPAAMAS